MLGVALARRASTASTSQPPTRLTDLLIPDFPVIYADQRVRDVWETVVDSPAERTPVLQDAQSRRLLGAVYKSDLLEQAKYLFM